MRILITGGSASGKSAHAERILCKHTTGNRLYLATMEPYSTEAQKRIARHHALRKGKGFETIEWYYNLSQLVLPHTYEGILLEDASNLLANEQFSGGGTKEDILAGIEKLSHSSQVIVVVSNEIFSDGLPYPPETLQYITALGWLNHQLAACFDCVAESVCGILSPIKGEQWL